MTDEGRADENEELTAPSSIEGGASDESQASGHESGGDSKNNHPPSRDAGDSTPEQTVESSGDEERFTSGAEIDGEATDHEPRGDAPHEGARDFDPSHAATESTEHGEGADDRAPGTARARPREKTKKSGVAPAVDPIYSVSLPSFEGPLDLLLQLCQKHELDILDIPIGFITEKYLEFLKVMTLMNLDVAADYLVMAATLAHIKSKMLLPAPPPGQEDEVVDAEEEDPREALIRRLLEYQKYKQAAADLAARGIAGRDVFLRGVAMEAAEPSGLPPLAEVPLFSLLDAFQAVLAKAKVKLTHDIVTDRISITDRIHELVAMMRDKKRIEFSELFSDLRTRFDLVITFLALLEMTRLRMTRLFQTDPLSPIYVEVPDGAISLSLDALDSDIDAEHAPKKADVEGVEAEASDEAQEGGDDPNEPGASPEDGEGLS